MAKYYFTNKAVEDLADIWNYTFENWSERQADKYYELLIITCATLAKEPNLGKPYNILTEGIFGYKIKKYIIFYEIFSKNEIYVIRILHGKMGLKNRLS